MKRFLSSPLALLLVASLAACGDDDAMTPDAASDAPPECTLPADCDDGLFCNGEETCVDGACVFRDAPACDDRVACTFDLCDEELDACVNAAPDMDGDGAMDAACLDADGTPLGTDCDDADGNRFPGNPEVCDREGHDEDCDLDTFGERDVDRDGFFDATCCNPGADGGEPLCGNDCNDARRNVNLEAAEACDGVDNDCDGMIDEGVLVAGFVDADRDGFGDPDMPMDACPGTTGFVVAGGEDDCDDANVAVNPGQPEICDGIDNDCDPETDDADAVPVTWYRDADGDGFGSELSGTRTSCEPLEGHSLLNTDCNDAVASISPAAAERCDAIDNDCNGVADFRIGPGDFEDDDGDGLVDIACGAPRGVDCDDLDPDAGPGTTESCDGRDNDCDDRVDEGAADLSWFYDGDGDGHGAASAENPVVRDCMPPPMHVASGADCDDADPDVRPGATELCDMRDGDCDGAVDEGGVCTCPAGLGDCDDDGVCETDTSRTPAHCGGCGMACAGPDATAFVCQDGACEVAVCAGGHDDCNGAAADGCEVDLRRDVAHCGTCGRACALGANVATARCVGGRCAVATCDAGFGDCNRDPSDGCETDLGSDPDHCGACGDACVGGRCTGATCRADCIPGVTEDCNGDASDGCETRVDTITDCGTCGEVCPGAGMGGSARCVLIGPGDRVCAMACDANFADCNMDAVDGCEEPVADASCTCGGPPPEDCATIFGPGATVACRGTPDGEARCVASDCGDGDTLCDGRCVNTGFDRNHCGGCGVSCGMGDCFGGECDCQPVGTGAAFCPGDGCVDTDFDDRHCGGCGVRCAAGERCEMGACNFDCGSRTFCGVAGCVDIFYDPMHCGGCDMPCAAGQVCTSGACRGDCTFPEADCDTGGCIDLRSDVDHCGRCYGRCPVGANAVAARCELGVCAPVCAEGFADCDGDPANGCEADLNDGRTCGSCDHDCGAASTCSVGFCDEVVGVETAIEMTCVVRSGGGVACWGDNSFGELAQPAGGSSLAPVTIPLPGPASQVAVQINAVCAVVHAPDPEVYCWGDDGFEQLGDGVGVGAGRPNAHTPWPVTGLPTGRPIRQLVAGWEHVCALVEQPGDDEVYCWGRNDQGESGNEVAGPEVALASLVPFSGAVPLYLQSGGRHTCAEVAAAGQVDLRCWGDGRFRQLGAAGGSTPTPRRVTFASSNDLRGLAGGQAHMCAAVGGGLWCWGDDTFNQGTTGANNSPPTLVSPPVTVAQVLADTNGTCVLGDGGEVYCSGRNVSSTLADVPEDPTLGWTEVPTPVAPAQLSEGNGNHRCYVGVDGGLYCWGVDSAGQLGVAGDRRMPVRIRSVTP